MKIIKQLNLKI